jgi:general nucleoside transport system permease protein
VRRPGRFGLCSVLCGLGLWWYALTIAPDILSGLRFGMLGVVAFPARLTMLGCGALVVGAGLLDVVSAPASRLRSLHLGINALGLVLGVLVWASMGRQLEVLGLLAQSLRLATPIALGALAGILCERCGVVNIGIEGMMLAAACLGFTVALYLHNVWVGVLAAVLVAGSMAALHAVLAIHGRVNQIIGGTVLNIFAVGITGFIRRAVLLQNPRGAPAVLPTWQIPLVTDLPVLGPIFFRLCHIAARGGRAYWALLHPLGLAHTCGG